MGDHDKPTPRCGSCRGSGRIKHVRHAKHSGHNKKAAPSPDGMEDVPSMPWTRNVVTAAGWLKVASDASLPDHLVKLFVTFTRIRQRQGWQWPGEVSRKA